MVKAIVVIEYGDPDVLQYRTYDSSSLNKTQVRIKHTAIGVNYIDIYYRMGLYPTSLPFIPGEEGVGIVEEIGADVTHLKVGDRVAYATVSLGAYCDTRVIDSNVLILLPDTIPDLKIAASLTRGLTAEYLLFACYKLNAGQSILIHAVTGGVGAFLCQWAKSKDVTVFGTVGDASKVEKALENGCDDVMIHTDNFSDIIKEKTNGALLDVVYDGIGKTTLTESMRCVKPRGLLVSFGNASGLPNFVNVLDLARQGSIYITRPRLYDYTKDKAELMRSAKHFFSAVSTNTIRFPEVIPVPLENATRAHQILQDRSVQTIPVLIP